MRSFRLLSVALLGVGLLAVPASAQRPVWEQAGTLNCDVSAGIGLIIGSRREVNCLFTPAYPGPPEQYVGAITKVGLDLGVTGGGQLVWSVLTSTTRRRGVLAGSYAGASAEASAIVGVGANLLVGGNDRSVALQPLSVQGQVGINVAAGIAEISLQFVR
jgi:Protein of unknown function (DUF992)